MKIIKYVIISFFLVLFSVSAYAELYPHKNILEKELVIEHNEGIIEYNKRVGSSSDNAEKKEDTVIFFSKEVFLSKIIKPALIIFTVNLLIALSAELIKIFKKMKKKYLKKTAEKLFTVNNIITVPNFMSLFRIVLLPFIVWAYYFDNNYIFAACLVLVSGITDILDGFIARKFNMVSELGKILDPIADKLTQGTLIVCLAFRYKLMLALVLVFALKEILMFVIGYIALTRNNFMNSARWYGKACTVILECVIMLLVFFPNIPNVIANILIVICMFAVVSSFTLYILMFIGVFKTKNTTDSDND